MTDTTQNEVYERIEQIFANTFLMHIGICDVDGPWVAPVTFAYDEQWHVYWLSYADARHSLAIHENAAMSAAFVARQEKGKGLGMQVSGRASLHTSPSEHLEKQLIEKLELPQPGSGDPSPLSQDQQWYIFVPEFIQLIDNERYGYERRVVDLR